MVGRGPPGGPGLDAAFARTHHLEADEFTTQMWFRLRPSLQASLRTLGIGRLPPLRRADLAALDAVLDGDVPSLRRAATRANAMGPLAQPENSQKGAPEAAA